MRILLMGAKGMLGTDMLRIWHGHEVIAADAAEADIRDLGQVRTLVCGAHPQWIVLTAAYTDVDGSEKNHDLAFAVNATGAENVSRAASEVGAAIFYVSTDYVFDGYGTTPYEPNDPVRPLNVYGESKAAGEAAVRKHAQHWCIGRTSWLFGGHGNSFPEKILRASETRPELTVVADQVGSPTYTVDLSSAILQLLAKNVCGIVHLTNSGSCSWHEFACEVLRQAGRESIRVVPVDSSSVARPASRPNYSILSPASLHQHGIHMRHWKETIPDYLNDRRKIGKLPRK
jgi:dTDP-4-dehydrorhamnose reductase